MTQDQKLLTDYVERQSETAFREIVAACIDPVFSAAARLTGDQHLARDVAQIVFVDLARMAHKLPKDIRLGGWLHRHTCFVAGGLVRGERRRLARERKAVEMNSIQDHTETNLAQVAPILDEAINQLASEDRIAILLRFFDQRDFRSVGEALGSSEDAARKRVSRALDKLRAFLQNRGVAFSAGTLASALTAELVTASALGLSAQITSAALSGAVVGAGTTINLLQMISTTKVKTAILAAIVITGMVAPLLMEQSSRRKLHEENAFLLRQLEQTRGLRAEENRLSNLAISAARAASRQDSNHFNELLRLRGQVGLLQRELFDQTNRIKNINRAGPTEESTQRELYSRTFKVDPKIFRESLQSVFPLADQSRGLTTYSGSAGGSPSGNTETAPTDSVQSLQTQVRDFFIAAGVDFSTNAAGPKAFGSTSDERTQRRKSVFFNDRTGVLLVRASLRDLDVIEESVRALNVTPNPPSAEP